MNNLFKVVFICSFILGFESMAQKTITSEEKKTISKGVIKTEAHNKPIPILSDKLYEPVDSEDEDGNGFQIDGMETDRSTRRIGGTPYTVTANNDDLDRSVEILKEWEVAFNAGKMSKVDFYQLSKQAKESIRGTAIKRLKQAKELLDAGKVSKVDFDKAKKSLEKYLIN